MGFRLEITVCFSQLLNEAYTISKLKRILSTNAKLHIRPVSQFGSAKKNKVYAKDVISSSESICSAAGDLCIRYDGECFICCGPPMVHNIPEYNIGNILNSNIETILRNYRDKEIISIMRKGLLPKETKEYQYTCDEARDGSLCNRCIRYSNGDTFGSMVRKES